MHEAKLEGLGVIGQIPSMGGGGGGGVWIFSGTTHYNIQQLTGLIINPSTLYPGGGGVGTPDLW